MLHLYSITDGLTMSYATDGKCHNSELGTHGHECGKPAEWIGTRSSGFQSGFCGWCKSLGYDGRTCVSWERTDPPGGYVGEQESGGRPMLPYGWGPSLDAAIQATGRQFAGMHPSIARAYMRTMRYRALHPEEASELLEYFDTPWN